MYREKVNAWIDAHRQDYIDMLTRWVRIPSIKSEAEKDAPFGPELRRMLDTAAQDIRAFGFPVRVFDGYAMDATLGAPEAEPVAVLGHLDVVPVGDGWTRSPFGAESENGRIYGRGTSDDKGPSIAALFAMKALAECAVPLRRSVRLILGCDEESGWEDMTWYAAHTQMPEIGFSPDAGFPIINTEKGMLHARLRAPFTAGGVEVKEFHNGERMNVIPGEANMTLGGGEATAEKIRAFAARTGLEYDITTDGTDVRVTARGIPGHAAHPEGKRNAIGMLLLLLRDLGVQGPLRTLADAVGCEYDGASLGIKCRDELTGPLTCNMGILWIENGSITFTLDCRCPVDADFEKMKASILAHLPGFTPVSVEVKAPHHVPAESDLVRSLLAAYHEETGLPAHPQSTGGGTYAKVLKQGVAFGASFPDDPDLAHQADEYVSVDQMLIAAKIYANALLRLCAE